VERKQTAEAAGGIAYGIIPIFSILSVFSKGKVIKVIKAIKISDTSPLIALPAHLLQQLVRR
jgi:hypothetical protein